MTRTWVRVLTAEGTGSLGAAQTDGKVCGNYRCVRAPPRLPRTVLNRSDPPRWRNPSGAGGQEDEGRRVGRAQAHVAGRAIAHRVGVHGAAHAGRRRPGPRPPAPPRNGPGRRPRTPRRSARPGPGRSCPGSSGGSVACSSGSSPVSNQVASAPITGPRSVAARAASTVARITPRGGSDQSSTGRGNRPLRAGSSSGSTFSIRAPRIPYHAIRARSPKSVDSHCGKDCAPPSRMTRFRVVRSGVARWTWLISGIGFAV